MRHHTSQRTGRRILLVSTNRCATPDAVFPLGLAFLNGALRRAGHTVAWLDYLADPRSLREVLMADRPEFVGVSIRNVDDVLIRRREVYFDRLGELCATVRAAGPCPVILGGSGFSIFPEALLARTGADFGIQGEGEASLVALIEALSSGGEVTAIPGLVYRRGDRVVVNPARPAPAPPALEAEDWPARLVDYYLRDAGMLNVQTQRGCAHACCYCTYPVIEGRVHRPRDPEAVAEEMARLEAAGARYVFLVDSIFNANPRHAAAVCEALLGRGSRLRWGCFLRPQGLTSDLVALMARAGLAHAEFGSDSLSDAVLEAYGKRFTFDDVRQANELVRRHRVDGCHFLICGGPGETADTLQESYEHSRQLGGAVIMAVVGMRVYPGTALQARAVQEGGLAPGADLLQPTYYLAPGLTQEGVFQTLQTFAAHSPNWVVGDPHPAYTRLVERLRSRGVAGPLWSYFSMIQRLWPAPPPATVRA